jgi:EmrB/QacA subfamily drug resistance transporter
VTVTPEQDTGDPSEALTFEAGGVDEVSVVPWPLMLHRRIARRLGARTTPSPWLVLVVALAGLFTVSFTITLLAVSLKSIAKDLHSSDTTLTWVITGPMLAFGVVGPSLGKAGDLWGHKRLFLFSLSGAAVFAVLTALSWNALSLIVFRVIGAGIGSATGPASMAMISRVFPPEDRAKALGYWSMTGAAAPVLGVVAGGPLVDSVGWRVIFVVQAPLCVVGIVLAALLLPETAHGVRSRFDIRGAAFLGLGITSLLLALNRGGAWGWTHPVVPAGFLLGALALVSFVRAEQLAPDPLIPLRYFRLRNFSAPIANQFLANFAYMGGFILTPLLLEDGLGYTTSHAGLLVVARPLAFAIAGPLAGFVTMRIGERSSGVSGALLVGVSMVLLSAVGLGTSDLFIVAALALSGVGLGISAPAMAATIANTVDVGDLGIAGATQQLLTQVGVIAGIQIMQTVQVSQAGTHGLIESYGTAYLVGAGVSVLAALCALGVRSRRPAFTSSPL